MIGCKRNLDDHEISRIVTIIDCWVRNIPHNEKSLNMKNHSVTMKKLIAISATTMMIATMITGCVERGKVEAENLLPKADFRWTPVSPKTGETITFDASASRDPDGWIVSYEWDWDDDGIYEESHTSPTATHSWSDEESYPVTLRVTDDDGATDTATHDISIVKEWKGTYYFAADHKLVEEIPSYGEEKYGTGRFNESWNYTTYGHVYNFSEPIDIPSCKWNATIWVKSPFAITRLSIIAYDEKGKEVDSLDSGYQLLPPWSLWFNKKIEVSGDFEDGIISRIGIYFFGWSPGSWLLNTTMVNFMYGGDHPSSVSFA
jgi:PKD repeat protein